MKDFLNKNFFWRFATDLEGMVSLRRGYSHPPPPPNNPPPPPTQIFPTFSSACRNVARMATKHVFRNFSKFFKRWLKCCQNGNKICFSNFSNIFQALAKMLPQWHQFFFFSKFSKIFRALAKMLP